MATVNSDYRQRLQVICRIYRLAGMSNVYVFQHIHEGGTTLSQRGKRQGRMGV
ncbi:hypothetical protein [Alteromonas australica]|uniref:hypothetical protein n=1 Tax=Alteromonas australica TaxID=589873 RepID=UPI0012DE2E09|nr:hypothetical protein [Alteromonas australica]